MEEADQAAGTPIRQTSTEAEAVVAEEAASEEAVAAVNTIRITNKATRLTKLPITKISTIIITGETNPTLEEVAGADTEAAAADTEEVMEAGNETNTRRRSNGKNQATSHSCLAQN